MLNHYETVFIATPVLSDAQIKETVQKFKSLIESEGGEVVSEEDWGLRKLAYPIQKKSTGFYYLLDFKAEPSVCQKIRRGGEGPGNSGASLEHLEICLC